MPKGYDTLAELQETTKLLVPAHLRSVYEATRIALDLKQLEEKKDSLVTIKERLIKESKSPDSLKSMDEALKELQNAITAKQQEISQHEDLAATQFKEIAHNIGGYADKIKNSVATALGEFSNTVLNATDAKINSTNDVLNRLRKEKMDVATGEAIRYSLEQFKKQVVDFQSRNMETIKTSNEKLFKDIVERMKYMLDNFEQNEMVSKTAKLVTRQLDAKLNEQLKKLNTQNEQQKQTNVTPEQLAEVVKDELNARLGPANLQSIISNMPEIQKMTEFYKSLPPASQTFPDYPTIMSVKEMAVSMNKDMVLLKQKLEETRSIVDSMRSQGFNANDQVNVTDQNAALTNMQNIERQVTVMHNNIKMIETALNTKNNSTEASSLTPRKRARTDLDGETVIDDEDIKLRLEEIESKHQKLLDFILQCKDNVLDDMFPTRLEAAMKKIERILINHETFIAFIIDPFSTKKKREELPMTSLSEDKYLNPAMIDCIQQLIKKTTEEAVAPLHKQIKELQEQLNKKQ
ncbi:hypothetical protein G6F57_011093 [Rhizopus arrhizus]|uniref:Uncharacterized protein n=1 Tax=Rhizopus oryzae TaxID=64495 RepID=A0A9P7BRU6_RHIOR|nr:hypothetical protein G6F23_008145 [Rhizopus arrhizus]KAG1410620.1 hypothetical protein G6F58_009021 [Rhizopus delemar]KAG0756638.1 hypothetical protein G6F24_011009 [Rhizopus arrhizus]KAG0780891.1 hypothetical protein G6F22_009844 [Rhizopus arrhizus]KAG0783769.1 hypothetical protein G6F21_010334 [Rhizopus arrhizus]